MPTCREVNGCRPDIQCACASTIENQVQYHTQPSPLPAGNRRMTLEIYDALVARMEKDLLPYCQHPEEAKMAMAQGRTVLVSYWNQFQK